MTMTADAVLTRPTSTMMHSVINTNIVDMHCINPDFAGVYAPEIEINQPRKGVTKAFLEEADAYFQRFEQFEYTQNNLKKVFDKIGIEPHGVVVDMGAGFGNSTIPLLRNYDNIHVIATDISPNLLAILGNLTERYGVSERCELLACDLLNDYFRPQSVDMVLGVAILHHLVDPMTLIQNSLKSLKKGGIVFFMEPFAEGHCLLRIMLKMIINRYRKERPLLPHKQNALHNKAIDFLDAICLDIQVRSEREDYPCWSELWRNLDDKWMFTCEYFYKAAKSIDGMQVEFLNLHDAEKPFLNQMTYLLKGIAGLECPACLPSWAWEMAEEFEKDYITPDIRESMLIEAAVIMTRK